MKKLKEGCSIPCPDLCKAEWQAEDDAIDNMGEPSRRYHYTSEYRNSLKGKGTGVGEVACLNPNCNKRIKITYTAPRVEVGSSDPEDQSPVVGYDFWSAKETRQISGNECVEGFKV